MPGGKEHGPSIKRPAQYEAIKEEGSKPESQRNKSKAAAISNEAAKGPAARSRMAKKAAATRKRRGT